jgi:hypothetical protein
MVFGNSTSAIAVAVTVTVMMVGPVQAADDARYPDWKGAWTRWFPPGSAREPNGGFSAGGQQGPRAYDATGLPLHFDNQSIFKERIFRDKADPTILHDVITVIDHALTRPWTVDKKYVHNPNPRPRWNEASCAESTNNSLIAIGRESSFMSADGMLMPVPKNQPPPDLRYFKQSQK